ncbi:MAG: hypothetical protein HW416_1312 [Chloroflexi bacterium]|nr:hypothetical protein [Chloroflexota bacterium]
MDGLTAIIVLILVLGGVVLVIRAFGGSGSLQVTGRLGRMADKGPIGAVSRQPTLETLRPHDAVSFWDDDDEVVESVIECQEAIGSRTSRWRWVILNGGRILEIAPDENVLYERSTVFRQGSEPFQTLTADQELGGALKLFEARVRDDTAASQQTAVTLDGAGWTVESTGTFLATFVGEPPRTEVWRDISANPSDNVYFELRGADGAMGLGIWTSHILLLQGRQLEETDVQNTYPGAEEGART